MMRISRLRKKVAGAVKNYPLLETQAKHLYAQLKITQHLAAKKFPIFIHPSNLIIHFSITSKCNQKCMGCRYGRDYMPGHQLPYDLVKQAIIDAVELDFHEIRLYGGEPLLHPDIVRMVSLCSRLNKKVTLTTNAVLLEKKIDTLFEAGLRSITIGFYGLEQDYDAYVDVKGNFARVESGIAKTKSKYGDQIDIQINWLLMKPSCKVEEFYKVKAFAEKYNLKIQIDLVHYNLPYFTEGPGRMLQFGQEDRKAIQLVVDELVKAKKAEPDRYVQTIQFLNSIPDWIMMGPKMRIPCTAYQMIFVAPDGTIQLCHSFFNLGNLYEARLNDFLNTKKHIDAARDAFLLKCPNCYCNSNDRIMRDLPSKNKYSLQTINTG